MDNMRVSRVLTVNPTNTRQHTQIKLENKENKANPIVQIIIQTSCVCEQTTYQTVTILVTTAIHTDRLRRDGKLETEITEANGLEIKVLSRINRGFNDSSYLNYYNNSERATSQRHKNNTNIDSFENMKGTQKKTEESGYTTTIICKVVLWHYYKTRQQRLINTEKEKTPRTIPHITKHFQVNTGKNKIPRTTPQNNNKNSNQNGERKNNTHNTGQYKEISHK